MLINLHQLFRYEIVISVCPLTHKSVAHLRVMPCTCAIIYYNFLGNINCEKLVGLVEMHLHFHIITLAFNIHCSKKQGRGIYSFDITVF